MVAEWSGDDDPLSDHCREDEDEGEDKAVLRGRVRLHAVVQGSNGLEMVGEAVGARGASGGGPLGRALCRHRYSGVDAFACPCFRMYYGGKYATLTFCHDTNPSNKTTTHERYVFTTPFLALAEGKTNAKQLCVLSFAKTTRPVPARVNNGALCFHIHKRVRLYLTAVS